MKKKLDYKRMVKEIDKLVTNDFCFDLECRLIPGAKPPSKEDIEKAIEIIGDIYSIAHCYHCDACQKKYLKK